MAESSPGVRRRRCCGCLPLAQLHALQRGQASLRPSAPSLRMLLRQALLLGKPGSECSAVPDAAHWTFAELESQARRGSTCLHACMHACMYVPPCPYQLTSTVPPPLALPCPPCLQLAALSSGIDLVRREAAAAGSGGITRQLGALAGQAGAVQQRATALLAAARRKAADTLRYLVRCAAVCRRVPAACALSRCCWRRLRRWRSIAIGALAVLLIDARRSSQG